MIYGIFLVLYVGLSDYTVHNETQFTESVQNETHVDEIDIDYYFEEGE